jgi:hypothetical protein
MPGILDMMGYIQQQGELGRQRGTESRLAALMGQAISGPRDQRQGVLGQIAQTGGLGAASGAQGFLSHMDADSMGEIAREAGAIVALADSNDPSLPAAYQQFAQKAKQRMGIPVPDTYDPKFLPGLQRLAGAAQQGPGVQSTFVDAQGNRVAILRDGSTQVLGQNAPNNQIIDTGNGFFGVNKGNLQAAPVVVGQPQRAPGEVPFSIDPSLPAEVQAAIRANEPAFAAIPDGAGVQLGPQGQQLRSAPKPQSAPAGYRYNGDKLEAIPGGPADPSVQALGNDNGRNYVITTGPDGTIYRVNKLTGQADAVEGARGGGASMANLDYKKDSLAVQKGTGANQIERGLQRMEAAVNDLSDNVLFDGGPLDKFVIGPTKTGQELTQAAGTIMPALTALTRVPGVGSQSDWEGRLNMLQLPSAEFSPEVNRRAIASLRDFIADLRAAYARAGIPFPEDSTRAEPKRSNSVPTNNGASDPLGIL